MEIDAIVSRTEEGFAYVKINEKPGGCGRCHESGGCASGALTQVFKRQECREFRLPNDIGAHPGETVRVSLPDGMTLRAAFWVYVLPLLGLLLGAGWGAWLDAGRGDLRTLLGALSGFALAILFAILYRRRHQGGVSQPSLSRILS